MHLLVGVSRHCPHSHRDKSRRDSSFTRTHCNHAKYHVSLLMLVCHHVLYRLPTSASQSSLTSASTAVGRTHYAHRTAQPKLHFH